MRIILVTSDLTYVPKNYNDVFEYVINKTSQHLAGIVIVKINKLSVLAKVPYLYFAGGNNMAHTLIRNLADALLGRKRKFLAESKIPFVFANSINDERTIVWLKSLKPDLILNMRARCIYKEAVLQIPRFGCVNVHHGILPSQRGLFCDLYALADDKTAGFTIHQMTSGIDQGSIFHTQKVDKTKNYIDYLVEVASKEKWTIVKFIENVVQNNSLPESKPNQNQKSIFTTTPNFKKIKELQHKGIIL
jgi:folate-dependent phosphoribosylglycinamide formyltransferase PurN